MASHAREVGESTEFWQAGLRGAGNGARLGEGASGLPPLELRPEDRASVRVLIVDDEESLLESCASVLRVEGYQVTTCRRGTEAVELVQRRPFDVVLVDLYMTQVSGSEILTACLAAQPEALVIVITGNPSVETSLELLRKGAWHYLPKPFAASHLQVLLARAAHTVMVARETRETRETPRVVRDALGPGEQEPPPPGGVQGAGDDRRLVVLGNSQVFRQTMELARRVAATDASVFISGESGTGKELIAQFIHAHSRRSSRPLIAVNCAALPEALLESEMFGHMKGAFTGAIRDKPGLLETANGGTLFLDELTEMPVALQAKLLRVIQDGVVRRVGSTRTDAVVNVRFIAATNRDPKEAVEEGVLRQDLYYRLRVVPITMPPLRERPDDIPLLARHFLAVYWARHRGKEPAPWFSRDALRALQERAWHGNVRELQNVIEHAVVLLEPAVEIQPDDLPFLDDDRAPPAAASVASVIGDEQQYHPARERIIAQFERSYLTWLVSRSTGNMSKAARIAGVDRTTLYRLMEKHGLQRDTIIRMNVN